MKSQLLKFGAIGLLGTSAHYLILVLGVSLIKLPVLMASSLGFIVGAMINHHYNRRFTFRSDKHYRHTLIQSLGSAVALFILNLVMMALLVHQLGVQYFFSQLVATSVVFIVGFAISKYFVFND